MFGEYFFKKSILRFLRKTDFLVISGKVVCLTWNRNEILYSLSQNSRLLWLLKSRPFLEFPANNSLSFNCIRKSCFILRNVCIYMEDINVPKLSVLAIFTGTNCGLPGNHAFTEHATDAIYPPPTGIQCGGLFISSVQLSGRSSVYGRRVCWHSKGMGVFERLSL